MTGETRIRKVVDRFLPALFLLTAIAAGAMLAYGIFRDEVGETMFNAAML